MRQAGIVAAAGVYAFDHHIQRLAEDHARAKRLAEGLAEAGLPVDVDEVETNFVQLDVAPLGITYSDAPRALHQAGVGRDDPRHQAPGGDPPGRHRRGHRAGDRDRARALLDQRSPATKKAAATAT